MTYGKTYHVFRFLNSSPKSLEMGKSVFAGLVKREPGFPNRVPIFPNGIPGFQNWDPCFPSGDPGFPNWASGFPIEVPCFLNGIPGFPKRGLFYLARKSLVVKIPYMILESTSLTVP